MYYAGVLVRLDPEEWETGLSGLVALREVELHQRDLESGRVVVTVETSELDRQAIVIDEIRSTRGVLFAEPVYAYRDEDEPDRAPSPEHPTPLTSPSPTERHEES